MSWNHKRIYYCQRGKGPLLVLLPGNTASSVHLQGELTYFSDRFRVIALDFLGTGQSDRVGVWDDQWWFQGARQVAALINYLGCERAILVGTSGGVVAALLTAVHFPERVCAVVGDSFVECAPPEQFRKLVIAERARRTPGQIEFWRTGHGEDWEQVVDADTAMLERFADHGADWFQGQLARVRCPVLITGSLQDELVPDAPQQFCGIVNKISDCRLYLHNDGGHPLTWSAPDAFRAVCNQFLKELSSLENQNVKSKGD
jgi:valacyclovir hydrolase